MKLQAVVVFQLHCVMVTDALHVHAWSIELCLFNLFLAIKVKKQIKAVNGPLKSKVEECLNYLFNLLIRSYSPFKCLR